MDFTWSDEQATFRRTVREFLATHLPADWESVAHGPASAAQTSFSKEFCQELAKAGLLVPHWPARWGGRDADAWTAFILAEEMWAAGEPRGGQYMNVNWIGPNVDEVRNSGTAGALHPDHGARRDPLVSGILRTGGWIGSRQLAHARRTAWDELPHRRPKDLDFVRGRGRYVFSSRPDGAGEGWRVDLLVPMDTPGITVRDIPSIIGQGDIHEVFFDTVEVPETARLGGEGEGWSIVRAALSLERTGIPRFALASRMLDRVLALLAKSGGLTPGVCVQSARARTACEVARLYSYRIVDQRCHGTMTGPEASAARVATVSCERLVAEFVVEYCPEALSGGDPMLLAHHQRAIVAGIASGAAEIQLDLVATQLLGLPREPR